MPRHEATATAVTFARFDIRPRRFLRREDAAFYVGVSATKFDQWVKDGRMPKPCREDGCVMWDIRKLDAAADIISDREDAPSGRELEF